MVRYGKECGKRMKGHRRQDRRNKERDILFLGEEKKQTSGEDGEKSTKQKRDNVE